MTGENASPCILWSGDVGNNGYGRVRVGGTRKLAHRHAWEQANGRLLADGEVVCHRCDTPLCVNPDHLFVGTQKDNVRDMIAKDRLNRFRTLTDDRGYAKLTPELALRARDDPRPSTEIALELGMSPSAIRQIKTGATWRRAIAEFLERQSHGQ